VSAIPPSGRSPIKSAFWITPAVAVLLVAAYFLRPQLPPPLVTGISEVTQDHLKKQFSAFGLPQPLVTDGSRIYFAEESPGFDTNLKQVSTDGGEVLPVEVPFTVGRISEMVPSRSELLIGGPPNGAGLWALPLPGGQPRRIGNLTATDATLSPDGVTLYYGYKRDVLSARTDGSQSHKLLTNTTNDAKAFWLRVSPDGHLLRFSMWDPKSHASSIWESWTDGSHFRPLVPGRNEASQCCGNWTADGKYFVFQAADQDGVWNLWAICETGNFWHSLFHKISRDPMRLTLGQMSGEAPLPSKDGKKVFFIGATRRGELVRYDLNTRTYAPYLGGLSAEAVSFSRDLRRIAYVSYPQAALWDSNADGSDRHELTFPPMQAALPRWSPDGTQIAFAGREPGKRWTIYTAAALGGDLEQVASGESDMIDPTWSPDGKSIVFGGLWLPSSTLHVLDLKTRKTAMLPGSSGLFSPRWSPDGRYLVAGTTDFRKLMLYEFASRQWQDFATVTNPAYPNWSQEGKCVYFTNTWLKSPPLYRVCLDERKLEHIGDLTGVGTLATGHFGWWTGLAPDNSILALRDISIEEIYALDVKFP
jgi:Tol biopolymer transport system component